jgi:hypothetical protein
MDDQDKNQTAEAAPDAQPSVAAAPSAAAAVSSTPPSQPAKLALAVDLVAEAQALLTQAKKLLGDLAPGQLSLARHLAASSEGEDGEGRIVEGVFDGQKMIGADGKPYSVPANYASKSKLVEGDLLKLTITKRGAFIYKQIGPIARRRLMGVLVKEPLGHEYAVKVNERLYRVLTASVTFFRGQPGDETVVLVPESGESRWAAVENIIKREGIGASAAAALAEVA